MAANYAREKSSFTHTDASVSTPKILTAAHLSSLRDLVSDRKITGEIVVDVVDLAKARLSQVALQHISINHQRKQF